MAVARMLSECFPVPSSTQGGELEYTRHRSPGAVCPTVASGLSGSLFTQASTFATLWDIFHMKYPLSLFCTLLPLPAKLDESFFSGVLHPWLLHAQLPRVPRFSTCLQCDPGHSHGSQEHAIHSPLQSAALFFIQSQRILAFKHERKEGKTKQRATEISFAYG